MIRRSQQKQHTHTQRPISCAAYWPSVKDKMALHTTQTHTYLIRGHYHSRIKSREASPLSSIASLFSVEALLYKQTPAVWMASLSLTLAVKILVFKRRHRAFRSLDTFSCCMRCLFCFGPQSSKRIPHEVVAKGKGHINGASQPPAVVCSTQKDVPESS